MLLCSFSVLDFTVLTFIYANVSICVFAECPIVQQLHSEMEEMHMLLNASRQQYADRLQLVQRHTEDTQRWLSIMDDKYDWISQLSNSSVGPDNIFSVIAVCLC